MKFVRSILDALKKYFQNPYIFLMICFVAAVEVAEIIAVNDFHSYDIAVLFVRLFLIVGIYRYPVIFCAVYIVFTSVMGALPDYSFPLDLWGTWFAFGLLAYKRKLILVALFVINVFSIFLNAFWLQNATWSNGGAFTFCVSIIVSIIAGLAISEHHIILDLNAQLAKSRNRELEDKHLKRNVAIARKLHDSSTHNLAMIVLLVEQCAMEDTPQKRGVSLSLIQECAQNALSGIRDAIDVLDDSDVNPSNQINRPNSMEDFIEECVNGGIALLDGNGIKGSSHIEVISSLKTRDFDIELIEEIYDLINQIFINISRYACKGEGSYFIYIKITSDVFILRQSNEIGSAARRDGLGRGLSLHEKHILQLGGYMKYGIDGDEWHIGVELPLG